MLTPLPGQSRDGVFVSSRTRSGCAKATPFPSAKTGRSASRPTGRLKSRRKRVDRGILGVTASAATGNRRRGRRSIRAGFGEGSPVGSHPGKPACPASVSASNRSLPPQHRSPLPLPAPSQLPVSGRRRSLRLPRLPHSISPRPATSLSKPSLPLPSPGTGPSSAGSTTAPFPSPARPADPPGSETRTGTGTATGTIRKPGCSGPRNGAGISPGPSGSMGDGGADSPGDRSPGITTGSGRSRFLDSRVE